MLMGAHAYSRAFECAASAVYCRATVTANDAYFSLQRILLVVDPGAGAAAAGPVGRGEHVLYVVIVRVAARGVNVALPELAAGGWLLRTMRRLALARDCHSCRDSLVAVMPGLLAIAPPARPLDISSLPCS